MSQQECLELSGPQRVSKGGGGGGQVYIQAFMYLSLARTSLHIMNLQIRVERGGEKRDKKFQMVKKSILLITNIYIYIK